MVATVEDSRSGDRGGLFIFQNFQDGLPGIADGIACVTIKILTIQSNFDGFLHDPIPIFCGSRQDLGIVELDGHVGCCVRQWPIFLVVPTLGAVYAPSA